MLYKNGLSWCHVVSYAWLFTITKKETWEKQYSNGHENPPPLGLVVL